MKGPKLRLEDPKKMSQIDPKIIRDTMFELLQNRGPGKSICPSEVVRALVKDWRPLMELVRDVAATEAESGRIRITQKGQEVPPRSFKGPIRLSLGQSFDKQSKLAKIPRGPRTRTEKS